MSLLLRSYAGSHLYGLSRPESDIDYYEVHTDSLTPGTGMARKAYQTIVDGVDVTAVSFSHFMDLAAQGSHQALDAMFSTKTVVDEIASFRSSFYVGEAVIGVYNKLIYDFFFSRKEAKRKHAARLLHNLHEMVETGRFNPSLSPSQVAKVKEMVSLEDEAFLIEATKITPYADSFQRNAASYLSRA